MQILLAGDSTVVDQAHSIPYNPAVSYAGWGQMLPHFLRRETAVKNFAKSGATVESFRKEGLFAKLCEAMHKDDYVLIQFGHNDQKVASLQPDGGYRDALQRYVEEIREAGCQPVLVTPVARNAWRGDTGEYNDLLAPYVKAMKNLAAACDVPLLDLHEASVNWIRGLGLQGAKRYFYPGDYTHPNEYGAYQWALFVAEAAMACTHPSMTRFQQAVLPPNDWAEYDMPMDRANPIYGWVCPPMARDGLAGWAHPGLLTNLEALEMATKVYAYFATTATGESEPMAVRAAVENGYLPNRMMAESGKRNAPVFGADFRNVMLLAAAGRNLLPPSARVLHCDIEPDGNITRMAAVTYALELERLATGCVGGLLPSAETGAAKPAGS